MIIEKKFWENFSGFRFSFIYLVSKPTQLWFFSKILKRKPNELLLSFFPPKLTPTSLFFSRSFLYLLASREPLHWKRKILPSFLPFLFLFQKSEYISLSFRESFTSICTQPSWSLPSQNPFWVYMPSWEGWDFLAKIIKQK